MRRGGFAPLLSALAFGLAAGGCTIADQGAFVRLQEEMVSVKKEAAAAKAAAASSPSGAPGRADAGELQAVRRDVADLSSSYDQVKSDLVASTTRADETKVQMQKEMGQLSDRMNEQGQAIQEIRGKIARLDEMERRLAALEEKTGKQAASAPPASAAAQPQEWKSPEEMYDYALGLVKRGEHRKGRELLSAFAAGNPNHRLMPNVLYWKGETFYAEKDYESAILSFQDVIDKHPSGDKAPDAMYKQGLSFLALNDRKNARILFELLLSKHPKSPAASLARQKLAELK